MEKNDEWVANLEAADSLIVDELIEQLVELVELNNECIFYVYVDLIFYNNEEFHYRQKGQLKLNNTIMEDFLPILVRKCIINGFGECDLDICFQTAKFSSAYFESSLSSPTIGGGLRIKTKNHDFSMSEKRYLKSSYTSTFDEEKTSTVRTHLGYEIVELKTNLDKTMYQEASATANGVKLAVTEANYYLLFDFLDMTPIRATIDIDEILIVRKVKHINTNIRKEFSNYIGQQKNRVWYVIYHTIHSYSSDVLKRFVDHIFSQMKNENLTEESIHNLGYF